MHASRRQHISGLKHDWIFCLGYWPFWWLWNCGETEPGSCGQKQSQETCTRSVFLLVWPVAKGHSNNPTLEQKKWIWGLQSRNIFKQRLVKDQKCRPANSEQGAKEKKMRNFSQTTEREKKKGGKGGESSFIYSVTVYSSSSSRLHKVGRISKAHVQVLGLKKCWQEILVFAARSPPAEQSSPWLICLLLRLPQPFAP